MIALASGARVAPAFFIFPTGVASLVLWGSLPLPETGMVRSQLSPIGRQPLAPPLLLELIILFTGDDLGSWDTV